jgi:hypothetical protein
VQGCFASVAAQTNDASVSEDEVTVYVGKNAQIFNNQQLLTGGGGSVHIVYESKAQPRSRTHRNVQSKCDEQNLQTDAKIKKTCKESSYNLFLPFDNAVFVGSSTGYAAILPQQNNSNKKLQKHAIKNRNNICFSTLSIPTKYLSKNTYLFFSNDNGLAYSQGNLPPPDTSVNFVIKLGNRV